MSRNGNKETRRGAYYRLRKECLDEVRHEAEVLGVSRSHVIELAVSEFAKKRYAKMVPSQK